jgi:CubicO group peptidase (beta-lactamase class C family)
MTRQLLLRPWQWGLVGLTFLALLLPSQAYQERASQSQDDAARAAGFVPEKLQLLPAAIQEAVDQKKIAGGAVLLARHGKVVYQAAIGQQDVESKVPLNTGALFRLASMSKPVTSVAAMQLVEDGKLNLTDPVSKFVPEFKEMRVLVPAKDGKTYELVSANRPITIHDLLTHTSGITYRFLNKPFVGPMYADAGVCDGLSEATGTLGDNTRKIAKQPLVCHPGTAWEYGLNTDVLGHVVEVVSGQSLEQFCQQRLFEPLKMNDTTFAVPKQKRARLSALFAPGPDKALKQVGAGTFSANGLMYSATYPVRDEATYCSGGAGLVSTLGDYYRFAQMLLNRGELDGVRVLKADTVDQISRNQLGDLRVQFPGLNAFGYGVGIVTETGRSKDNEPSAVGSYSWAGAFGTIFWVDPQNALVGVFMAQTSPGEFLFAQRLKRLAYDAMNGAK